MSDFLEIHRGDAPLVVSFPHTGTDLPPEIEPRFVSPWLARKDTDWWVERLYGFARDLGATTLRTRMSRLATGASCSNTRAPPWPTSTQPGS